MIRRRIVSTARSFSAVPNFDKFELRREFVSDYIEQSPPFGFNGLGELVYTRYTLQLQPSVVHDAEFSEHILELKIISRRSAGMRPWKG